MKEKPWYPVAYMFVVTAVFSGILIGLHKATAERVARNEQLFRRHAVVVALGVAEDDASGEEILRLYESSRIRVVTRDRSGPDEEANVEQYLLVEEGGEGVAGYGVPIIGRGYWNMIRGVVGVAGDGRTVIGIAFYEQQETPGLGAEITSPQWRSQFKGKILADGAEPIAMRLPGAGLDESSVHAVTGATQTSVRLAKFMNAQLAEWRRKRRTIPPETGGSQR